MIILTYIWRVTNNHFTALLHNPTAPQPLPAYSRIQEHLVQGTILHLTALPDQVAIKTFMMPPNRPGSGSVPSSVSTNVSVLSADTGVTGSGGPPGSVGQTPNPPAASGTGRSQPDPASGPHRLNKPSKTLGMPSAPRCCSLARLRVTNSSRKTRPPIIAWLSWPTMGWTLSACPIP